MCVLSSILGPRHDLPPSAHFQTSFAIVCFVLLPVLLKFNQSCMFTISYNRCTPAPSPSIELDTLANQYVQLVLHLMSAVHKKCSPANVHNLHQLYIVLQTSVASNPSSPLGMFANSWCSPRLIIVPGQTSSLDARSVKPILCRAQILVQFCAILGKQGQYVQFNVITCSCNAFYVRIYLLAPKM